VKGGRTGIPPSKRRFVKPAGTLPMRASRAQAADVPTDRPEINAFSISADGKSENSLARIAKHCFGSASGERTTLGSPSSFSVAFPIAPE
jgi:hypothetical protein